VHARPAKAFDDRPALLGNFLGNNSRDARQMTPSRPGNRSEDSTSSHPQPPRPMARDTFRDRPIRPLSHPSMSTNQGP
jgi:hypothetical protein